VPAANSALGGNVRLAVILMTMVLTLAGTAAADTFADGWAAFQRGDYATALAFFQPLADQGDAAAQNSLGFMYANGQGVPQSYAEAMKWYRKAAEQGNASAQTNLGFEYAEGRGVPQDYSEALKWWRQAAEQDEPKAQYNLGVMYEAGQGAPQDYVQAHMWFDLAASRFFAASEEEKLDAATRYRDHVAAKMTPDQIAEAQRLAREWRPTK
jgi:uncharacterized protein